VRLAASISSGSAPFGISRASHGGRIDARRGRPADRLADFLVAALRVHHDPPGFPAVQFLVAAPVGQRGR
jgi:hypothetical protein